MIKKINWKNHDEFPNEIQGMIDDQEVFTIKPIKNSNQVKLLSWPFKNETFVRSTASKDLGTFLSESQAKDYAETSWESFVNNLLVES